jgi:hypothetical protein
MPINWNTLPPSTAIGYYRQQLSRVMNPSTYGPGDNEWSLTEIMKQTPDKKIPALMLISGDEPGGRKNPDREFKNNGMPMMFRLKVLTRQACHRDKTGKLICRTDEEFEFDKDQKILVNDSSEKPKPGDVVRWKDRIREPDTMIPASSGYNNQEISAMMAEPHLSSSHLDNWKANGEECHIWAEFTVDDDLCILVPFKFAQPMLKQKGFRMPAIPQFMRTDRVKAGEKPKRRITNWWFQEVFDDYRRKKKKQTNDALPKMQEIEGI